MKGSPVRVRASALTKAPHGRGFLVSALAVGRSILVGGNGSGNTVAGAARRAAEIARSDQWAGSGLHG
jgi:hypothetical protein